MGQKMTAKGYSQAIKTIKNAILKSRYRAAALANRELLSLYYGIGKFISENSREGFWGTGAIDTISQKLQQELPGLRGFSAGNLKKMRIFFEQWYEYIEDRALLTNDLGSSTNRALPTHDLAISSQEIDIHMLSSDRQLLAGGLSEEQIKQFLSLGFTHHYELLNKTDTLEERLFYIERCAAEFWSVEALRYNLQNNLYKKRGKLPNNFKTTISDKDLQRKALMSFKDEYLLDFVNIESPDEEPDERVLESEIVNNIRKFIMSLGKDFSFIGNQYRIMVEEQEYFIDLLFFNRQLQCLVAFELKRGDFKPEYLGKMNFYLSALDDLVRLPHENPSIGIILCKSKKQKIVEYAFRDMTKPMGVAVYKTAADLPSEYKNVLPDAERLKELL
jgi:predicted nuclease of restriction endonuclease-like (RecB) superfamily